MQRNYVDRDQRATAKIGQLDSAALRLVEFNIPVDTLQVISETMFPANLMTGTKHSAFSTNHLTDIDKTKHNYNQ